MFTLMALFGVLMIGAVLFAALVIVALAAKFALKLVLLPLKLLLLPIIAILVLVKVAVLFTVGAVLFAIFVPLAILCAIFAAPFFIAAAVFG